MSDDAGDASQSVRSKGAPRVTVVFLLYNAQNMVRALLAAVRAQRHSDFERQSDWLECIIMDDCSSDKTAAEVRESLAELPVDVRYRFESHEQNQGLARTVNHAFELATAPYVLTCHCDCLFGDDAYVARLLQLMDSVPDAAAITGKPMLPRERALPFAERVNAVTNLMDILPDETDAALLPIGFAEGRCDIFRVEAMRAAGMYQTTYRTAGEDQALAARFRQHGYSVYQAPRATYVLSVSDEQNTLAKLLMHGWLFGKMHPLLLLRDPTTREGVIGGTAGSNRRSRALLRALQIVSVCGYVATPVMTLLGTPLALAVLVLVAIFGGKLALFHRHIAQVGFSSMELIGLLAFQPLLDIAYVAGLVEGTLLLARDRHGTRSAT